MVVFQFPRKLSKSQYTCTYCQEGHCWKVREEALNSSEKSWSCLQSIRNAALCWVMRIKQNTRFLSRKGALPVLPPEGAV